MHPEVSRRDRQILLRHCPTAGCFPTTETSHANKRFLSGASSGAGAWALGKGCQPTDALLATRLSHLPSAGTPPANKPRSLRAAPRPRSHCSRWADWAVVRWRAGRTSTRGMTGLVQSRTSYCSCLPPSPSLSHKIYLCLTLSTPFFSVFFFFFSPETSDMNCKMSGSARPCGTIQISRHQVGDSIFLQSQKNLISLHVLGTL